MCLVGHTVRQAAAVQLYFSSVAALAECSESMCAAAAAAAAEGMGGLGSLALGLNLPLHGMSSTQR